MYYGNTKCSKFSDCLTTVDFLFCIFGGRKFSAEISVFQILLQLFTCSHLHTPNQALSGFDVALASNVVLNRLFTMLTCSSCEIDVFVCYKCTQHLSASIIFQYSAVTTVKSHTRKSTNILAENLLLTHKTFLFILYQNLSN